MAKKSHGETLSTTTTAAGIRVTEIEALPIQTLTEIECGVYQVKKTFQVGYYLQPVVFENLVIWFLHIIEIHFIA